MSFITYPSYTLLKMATKKVAETCRLSLYIIKPNILHVRIGFILILIKQKFLETHNKVVLEKVRLQAQSKSTNKFSVCPPKNWRNRSSKLSSEIRTWWNGNKKKISKFIFLNQWNICLRPHGIYMFIPRTVPGLQAYSNFSIKLVINPNFS